MMEMHSFQKAKQFEISSPNGQAAISVQHLFTLMYEISEWAQSSPFICRGQQKEANIVYALWDNIAFIEDDIWQTFGTYLVALYPRWKMDLFSTASEMQETIWMSLEEDNQHFYVVQKNLSGQPAHMLQSLCIRITCSSLEESEIVQVLLESASMEKGIAAVDWKYSDFLSKERYAEVSKNSRFYYESVFEDTHPSNYLKALNFDQKTSLWMGFLKDGFDYSEFEWLYDEISKNMLVNRIEWELTLHIAMQKLGYTIQTSLHGFELYDGQGNRRYFSFNSSQYSERAFLKILFPLNL